MISILIADDHPMILRGLRDLFEPSDEFCVVGEETHASRVLDAVAESTPDMLILDLVLHGVTSFGVVEQVSRQFPGTSVVMLSMHSGLNFVSEAFKNGARGYALKSIGGEELIEGLRKVRSGHCYLSPPLCHEELEGYLRGQQRQGQDRHDGLTKREREVLTFVAQGYTSGEIADRLGIGKRTVESHRANILSKLGLRNQAGLARYALEKGMIVPD